MATIAHLARPGRWLGFDLFNAVTLHAPWTRERIELLAGRGLPWRFGPDDPVAWLQPLGWTAMAPPPSQVGRRCGRWPYPDRQ